MRIVQKVSREREIALRSEPEVSPVPDDIVDPQTLFGFAGSGQSDHVLGQIHPGDFRRAALADHPGVETFPAGDVDHGLPAGSPINLIRVKASTWARHGCCLERLYCSAIGS